MNTAIESPNNSRRKQNLPAKKSLFLMLGRGDHLSPELLDEFQHIVQCATSLAKLVTLEVSVR
jgi:hypothetical protein